LTLPSTAKDHKPDLKDWPGSAPMDSPSVSEFGGMIMQEEP
jgi:hypothetical protein